MKKFKVTKSYITVEETFVMAEDVDTAWEIADEQMDRLDWVPTTEYYESGEEIEHVTEVEG